MSSSAFNRILPFKNPTLWKGFALGLGMLVLLLAVFIFNGSGLKRAPASSRYFYPQARLGSSSGGDMVSENMTIDAVQADGPKIIHKAQLDLLVANCAETQKKIEALAASEKGFVESSTLEENSAKITLRIPSERFEAVRAKLRDLALRVKEDSVTAADVSKQYIDRESRLRNLRAEEQQFLEVMKKAHTVPDVLAVTKELSEVRGQIEQADAEFRHLKDQIDMAQIDVHLFAQGSGDSHWALGASIKSAFKEFLESLTSFADFLIWLVVNLPLVVLWGVTIFILAAACWYVLRKAARLMRAMFRKKGTGPESPQASSKA